MASRRICDGCGTPLYKIGEDQALNGGVTHSNGRELMVQGERANGMRGGDPLPQGQFHWCERCAKIAFRAVEDARLEAAGWKR